MHKGLSFPLGKFYYHFLNCLLLKGSTYCSILSVWSILAYLYPMSCFLNMHTYQLLFLAFCLVPPSPEGKCLPAYLLSFSVLTLSLHLHLCAPFFSVSWLVSSFTGSRCPSLAQSLSMSDLSFPLSSLGSECLLLPQFFLV